LVKRAPHQSESRVFPRRWVLQAAVAAPALWVAGRARANAVTPQPGAPHLAQAASRHLCLFNTHTSESQVVHYCADGQYVPEALGKLNLLLRDHRSGESHPIDPRLFDALHQLARLAGREPDYEVISGYRSPASNAQLNASSSGVARNSLHMQGRAIDVRLRGFSCARLRDLALSMQLGGVGFYAKSAFVHLDTGRVRSWSG
jgi:uncharacterized protein YcbK (DUF882 family)